MGGPAQRHAVSGRAAARGFTGKPTCCLGRCAEMKRPDRDGHPINE
ncbi:hypothetical protein C7S13_5746 [Burkholderia cepacia]|nr:hypothetical protein [Burkholderia cepacia]MDW9249041.1 hypothetical protein [Burkholderia cepacia]QOH38051.1 hypothetical protein C7S14_0047 [Burkholderia cepacia]